MGAQCDSETHTGSTNELLIVPQPTCCWKSSQSSQLGNLITIYNDIIDDGFGDDDFDDDDNGFDDDDM